MITDSATTDQAGHHVTQAVLAAAWREDLTGIRTHATTTGDTTTTTTDDGHRLRFTAHHNAFHQIHPYGPILHNGQPIVEPGTLLHLLHPGADTDELDDAVAGLTLALHRHRDIRDGHRDIATRYRAATSIELAQRLQDTPDYSPCRHFEPLAVEGHHLHPGARTRLGWTHHDRLAHDLESRHTTRLRFLAADRDLLITTGEPIDAHIAQWFPQLTPHLDDDHVIIPMHPWQYRHATTTSLRPLLRQGRLHPIDDLELPAEPTSSIRTLVTTGGHYLKCSLNIHITSTRRGISPATAANGPVLSAMLADIIEHDPRLAPNITVLAEPAAVSLPDHHPAARDLTCILRQPLAAVCAPDELAVPATALTAHSPVSGQRIITELITAADLPTHRFLHRYAKLLLDSTLHLAGAYGIGMEAHLQNCIPTFRHGHPHRIILRDLGGARIHLPRLHATGHHPDLHPASVTVTTDIDQTRAKVAYTVLQNHLAAIVAALTADDAITPDTAWQVITDIITDLDIPTTDRDYYTAPSLPLKALLHMRLTDGPDHHIMVDNPLHRLDQSTLHP